MQSDEVTDQQVLAASLINNLGIAVVRDNRDAVYTGIAMLRRAMALNPNDMHPRVNLASFLMEHGGDDESEALLAPVLQADQNSATAWQILGLINTNRGRMADAIACFKRSYESDPHSGQRKFDLAAAYMRAGDFANGLPLYEFRREILPMTGAPPDAPAWKGENTGHLAVWPDQGHGDLIMFSRFLPWARERCEKLSFIITAHMLPLFQGFNNIVDVTHVYHAATKFDHQISLASLPLVYGLTPENIPPDPGLLSPAATDGPLGGSGLKIGIAWQGNPQFPGDTMRSIPFREFLPLAADPRNTVISIQVGSASADIAKARAQRLVRDMSADIEGEWSHTAALIRNLDLVVSSCTAIPHLAGALGVPVFLMLPQFADWRWLHGRDDTPWYPNTRLFRQTKVGDWSSVMARVLKAVDSMHNQRAIAEIRDSGLPVFNPATMVDPNQPGGTADTREPDVAKALRKVLRTGDTFIDVGANAGMHTILAAELVGEDGKVLAFEPGENVLPELRKATEALPQVEIIAHPLWNKSGEEITFHLCADGSGGNSIWDCGKFPTNRKTRADPQSRKMLTTTLDRSAYSLSPRLIKIDTEGAEQRVLEGAAGLLFEKRPPFIIAEFHPFGLNELGCSLASLREFMLRAGYRAFILFPDGSRPLLVLEGKTIKRQSDFIINLLFSTEAEVNALWTEEPAPNANRNVYAFRTVQHAPPQAAESAA